MTVTADGAPSRKTRWSEDARAREKVLFARLRDLDPDDPRRREIRDEIVTMHLPLVEYMARRFQNRGEPHEDLAQVGTIGLIKAVDRFDTGRGVEFSTYATPTILGEIKRHFRDRGWSIRVPRRLQDLRAQIAIATSELSQRNGRSPTVAELAEFMGCDEDEVLEGIESAQAYSTLSLDASAPGDDDADSASLTDTLGADDSALEGVEYRETLKPLLAQLSRREQDVLVMRFFQNQTQSQIAEAIGVSQMQVSRILAKALAQLRSGMTVDPY